MCFRIRSTNFEVNYLFLSLLIIYLAFDRTGIYLPLLISVMLHEISHIFCLMIFKCRIYSVRLNVGAITIKYNEDITRVKKIVSILIGPFSNFFVSFFSLIFKNETLFYINLILAFYNLLPINGLDGGEIIKTLLSGVLTERTTQNILRISTAMAVAMVLIICFVFEIFSVYVILFCFYLISPLIFKILLKH